MKNKKYLFNILLFISLLFLLFKHFYLFGFSWSTYSISLIFDLLLRLSGTVGYVFFFLLIVYEEIFGKRNIILDFFVLFLFFLHPFFWIGWNYFVKGNLDIYYPYVDICLLCKNLNEHLINLGRISLWLLGLSFLPKIIKLGKKRNIFSSLEYFAFYFVTVHSFYLGTGGKDTLTTIYYIFTHLVVAFILWKKLRNLNLSEELSKILD